MELDNIELDNNELDKTELDCSELDISELDIPELDAVGATVPFNRTHRTTAPMPRAFMPDQPPSSLNSHALL